MKEPYEKKKTTRVSIMPNSQKNDDVELSVMSITEALHRFRRKISEKTNEGIHGARVKKTYSSTQTDGEDAARHP